MFVKSLVGTLEYILTMSDATFLLRVCTCPLNSNHTGLIMHTR